MQTPLQRTQALISEELKLYGSLVRSTLVYHKPHDNEKIVFASVAGDLSDYLVTLQKEVADDGLEALEHRLKLFAKMPGTTTVQKHTKIKQKAILEHLLHGDRLKLITMTPMECGGPACVKTENLLACGGCSCIRYCSTRCQKSHWKNGGHRRECAHLADVTRDVEKQVGRQQQPSDEDVEKFLKDHNMSLGELVHAAPSLFGSMHKK